ncbi:unnamed protein product [Caenorhabditis nigoni]
MPFPILRTPFVVLSEIITLLTPSEIVTASFCSNKVKELLKRHHQRRKPLEWRFYMINNSRMDYWTVLVDIALPIDDSKMLLILAEPISKQNEVHEEHELVETNEYKRGFRSKYPVLYFENLVIGSKMIVDYVTDLFNLDIYGLGIDRNGIWAIDWINNRQEKMLQYFDFVAYDNYNRYEDEALDSVLRKARPSDYYIRKLNFSDSFRFVGKLGPANFLFIGSNGHWVTLDNLMNFDFVNIVIEESRISASDLQSFLEHWRADFENFEEEVEMEITQTDNVIEYHLSNGEGWHIHDGYSIQRNDGVKAVIDFDSQYFVMIVSHGR